METMPDEGREARGRVMADAKKIRRKGPLWMVPSASHAGTYVVDIEAEEGPTCTCPDWELRPRATRGRPPAVHLPDPDVPSQHDRRHRDLGESEVLDEGRRDLLDPLPCDRVDHRPDGHRDRWRRDGRVHDEGVVRARQQIAAAGPRHPVHHATPHASFLSFSFISTSLATTASITRLSTYAEIVRRTTESMTRGGRASTSHECSP